MRRLFCFLTCLICLALAVVVARLWDRSYRAFDAVMIETNLCRPCIEIRTAGGGFDVYVRRYYEELKGTSTGPDVVGAPNPFALLRPVYSQPISEGVYFRIDRTRYPIELDDLIDSFPPSYLRGPTERVLARLPAPSVTAPWLGYDRDRRQYAWSMSAFVPYWLIIVLLLVLALALRSLGPGKRSLRRPGHCESCGYDMRATPHRCPECGTVPSPKQIGLFRRLVGRTARSRPT